MIYGLMADIHFHSWSAFSSTNENGINSRLQIQLDEVRRCAKEVRDAGGNKLVIAGDVFHVRGSLAPSVLNPVMDLFSELTDDGFEIEILAGNHDLEGKNADRVSSAITALERAGCKVINSPVSDGVMLSYIPWFNSVKELKEILTAASPVATGDLILHAPIDDVIYGLPSHGLTADFLSKLGYNRVFSGHYHNHKDFGNAVYSIGALTHQTWSDVGAKAGFLIVHEDKVVWRKSHAPAFVDIHGDTPEEDVPLMVDGNYIRIKTTENKAAKLQELRKWLIDDCGAVGVIIQSVRESKEARTTSVKSGLTLEASVKSFIDTGEFENKEALALNCAKLLEEVIEL
ncbi:endonuclease subunit [uncultured Caudovirales phage]|uniref:Endonuclease subunit n=1 Tax=uncultured Caudovirales phage TaxID=2100421 RepID=A0A6J7WNB0_9CAUD|nr:endonuclease subunit [uncultured Caudovirales phage]CAB4123909.1 endonuclease subunit [uncultured Caudovirales phage]CAB5219396.1 endonuclease subunit [uncultured Caudovirales phage]